VAFETARRFIAGAAQVLAPEGRLYLVANTFLRYEPWLRQHFSAVSVAWEDRRFRVWEAR
jgi:16S rRNA G1207 methylase RsmC